jgi:hypothetical protein
LVIDDIVKDETFRVAVLRVSSTRAATLSIDGQDAHAAGELLMPGAGKLREGRAIFLASRTTNSSNTNTLIQVSFQVKSEGGDGEMSIQGDVQSGGTTVYTISTNTQLAGFLSVTGTNGNYPLETPLEIGRVNGTAVTLTVGKPTNQKLL